MDSLNARLGNYALPPLLPLCLSLIMGIIAGNIYPEFKILSVFPILLVLFFIIVKIVKRESSGFLYMALFFFLGFWLISFAILPDLPQNHILRYADKGKFLIQGRVCSFPFVAGRTKKLILSVEKIEIAGRKVPDQKKHSIPNDVTGKIKLTIYGIQPEKGYVPEIKYGDVIRFKSSIKSIHNFNNPGGFDYVRYMTFKSVFGSAWAEREKIEILNHGKNFGIFLSFLRSVEDYRSNFSSFIFRKISDKNTAAVLTALVTGEKQHLGKKLRKEFSKAGASHILAISGLHLSIVAGIFFYFFKWLLSFFTPLLIRGWNRKGAAVMTLFPLIFYGLLSGFSPSTKRALVMVIIFMFSFVVQEESDSLNSLAAAGIAILIMDPGALFSISFQLSFTAVLSIILGFILIKKLPSSKKKNFQTRLILFIFTSFCAIAGTNILVMYYFNIISFVGIFTNLLIIPCAGFAAVPLGLSALFAHPFSVTLSGLLVKCCEMILTPCLIFIHYISNFSFTWARTITPDLIEISCYYVFFAGIFLLLKEEKRPGLFCIISALVIFSGNEILWINKRFFNQNLCVTILDVGQGSSALIEAPKGKRILVDGGGFSYFANFDTGEYIVAPFLWQKKIMTLDMVVLTHPEADHMNGLVYIFNNFKVKTFIKNCDTRKTIAYGDLMKSVVKNGSRVDIIYNNKKRITMGSGAYLDFLNSFIRCSDKEEVHKNLNNNSVVFRLVFKNASIFFPGDIMENAEKNIALAYGKKLKSDVLISPHHGSSTSSSDFFLDKIAPESVVISCGRHNRFHFPNLSVLERYRRKKIRIFRTDFDGAVQIYSNGNYLNFFTCRGE